MASSTLMNIFSRRMASVHSCASQRAINLTRTRVCSTSGRVDPVNVRDIAKMAHIAVTDEEVKDWAPKIEGIVSWFGQLQQVDVEGVTPALRAAGQENEEHTLRLDEAVAYAGRDQLLAATPGMEGGLLKIPKILASDAE